MAQFLHLKNPICFNFPPRIKINLKYLNVSKKSRNRKDLKNFPLKCLEGNSENVNTINQFRGKVIPTDLQSEMSRSYMEYAMSVIYGRALPDVRDGLKPVHRRILFAMFDLGLKPEEPFKKCARIVGEVLGKYHPHGDSAVYDSLVRMAQEFSMRSVLINGHGNFGSIDHDPAAAMRYTECKLSYLSDKCLISNIEKRTVDFVNNFDGTSLEPEVLPASLPFLLLNGSNGIAVGMATNVPSHNLTELSRVLIEIIQNPYLSDFRLKEFIPGPDFPTGGTIVGLDGCYNILKTGNAVLTLRGNVYLQKISEGGITKAGQLIITELPFQINKPSLMGKIADLVNEKVLEGITDLRDESDRNGVRIILEIKKFQDYEVILNNVFKKTPLQTSFNGNLLTIVDRQPETLSIREILNLFVHFRRKTIRRETQFKLDLAIEKNHGTEGLMLTLKKLENILRIIRSSENNHEAKIQLMEFGLTQDQSDSILNIQLRRLTKLEFSKLNKESILVKDELSGLTKILFYKNEIDKIIIKDLNEILTKFGMRRKTKLVFSENKGSIEELEMVENFPTIIIMTRYYIKRMVLKEFYSQRRGTRGKKGSEIQENDTILDFFACKNHDKIICVTREGIAFSFMIYRLPLSSRTAKGIIVDMIIPGIRPSFISASISVSLGLKDGYIILLTRKGLIKKLSLNYFQKITARGLIVMGVNEKDFVKFICLSKEENEVVVATKNGKAIRFSTNDDVFRATGRLSKGVKSIKLSEKDEIRDVDTSFETYRNLEKFLLIITSKGYGKKVRIEEMKLQKRGGSGLVMIKFKKEIKDSLVGCKFCYQSDELISVSGGSLVLRQFVEFIPTQSRYGKGVRIQKLGRGDSVIKTSILRRS